MPKLIYLIGQPGTGKSTLLKRTIQALGLHFPGEPKKHGLMQYYELPNLIAIGSYAEERGGYGGTDALPMNVMPEALRFLSNAAERWPEKHLFAEGDRLASAKFFQEAELVGYDLRVFCLHTEGKTLEDRYDERGSNQSRSFIKSRKTKCTRLSNQVGAEHLISETQEDLHSNLSRLLNELS